MLSILAENARIQGDMGHPEAPKIEGFRGSWNTRPRKVISADGVETAVLDRVFTIETRVPDPVKGSKTSGFYNCIVKDEELKKKIAGLQWKMVSLTGVLTFNRETKYLEVEVTSVEAAK
jgi:hypothetical protein